MRPLFKVIIAVFIILIALAVASQVRGSGVEVGSTKYTDPLVTISIAPKTYTPADHKGTWVSVVNYLMTHEKWYDIHDNEMYHQGFALNDESCTLAYNHTNGTLTMTINKLTDDSVNIIGKGEVVRTEKSKELSILTLVSINQDTMPDLAVMQHVVLNSLATEQIATTVVFSVIPQVRLHPLRHKREIKMQLDYMREWALWEVHIMDRLGFKMVIPPKKEKM